MATFGYLNVGVNIDNLGAYTHACKFNLLEPGTVTSISVYTLAAGANSVAAIYSDNAGNPNALLITSNLAVSLLNDWTVYPIAVPVLLPAGTYWIADPLASVHGNNHRYDAGGVNQWAAGVGGPFPTMPDPFGVPAATLNWVLSMYATYTPAGGSKRLLVNVGT